MDPDILWLCVRPSYSANEDTVKAYLYEGTALHFATSNIGYGDIVAVLVHGRPGRADVRSYAEYQADRLRSGLHRVTIHDSYEALCDAVRDVITDQEQSSV